jgi:hypothetical protein
MATASSNWPMANTPHGMLVAFGEFLSQHALIERLMQVPIAQKTRTFRPQTRLPAEIIFLKRPLVVTDNNQGSHFNLESIAILCDTTGMSYPGGKNGAGVYKTIVNQIPPHEIYIEPFAGGGAVLLRKRPARCDQAATVRHRCFRRGCRS